ADLGGEPARGGETGRGATGARSPLHCQTEASRRGRMSHDPAPTAERLHATCIAFGEFGVLLIGPSGSGKSDLALRLIDEGGFGIGTSRLEAALVSDDQVLLQRQGDEVMASAPATIAALLEVRGLG